MSITVLVSGQHFITVEGKVVVTTPDLKRNFNNTCKGCIFYKMDDVGLRCHRREYIKDEQITCSDTIFVEVTDE